MTESPALTDPGYWDDYWSNLELPAEIRKSDSLYIEALTDVFDSVLPPERGLRALEIGGAPGQYLAYLHRRFGYEVAVLDSSPLGARAAEENMRALGIAAQVLQEDMFEAAAARRKFDVVYSLGLIEHFVDPATVVEAHLRFVEPGGFLMIGCPNFRGINSFLWRRLAPSIMETVHAPSADMRTWREFEERYRLEPLFKGYAGGFEPGVFWRCESRKLVDRVLARALRELAQKTSSPRTRRLRRLNSPLWSAYELAVYRVP